MPKDLQNKPCRADTKYSKSNIVASAKNCAKKNSSLLKVTKILAGKIVKKKNSTTTKLRKILTNNNAEKVQVKRCRKKADIPIKTRSGACLVDSNAGKTTGGKMKEKQKPAEKVKPNDKPKVKKEPAIKKSSYIAGNTVTTIKKDTKKVKDDETVKKTVKNDKSNPRVADKPDDDKKETKISAKKTPKLKKDDDKKEPKKDDESVSKKDNKKDSKTKDDTSKGTDKEKDKSDPPKKRVKKTKEPNNETANKKEDDKSPSSNDTDKKESSQVKKIKFFKSKSKKLDKTKEPSKKNNELKDAFSVYDNIDDSSNDEAKVKKKEPLTKTKVTKIVKEAEMKIKQNMEEFKKSKLKRKLDVMTEKRKLDSDSEVEKKCRKKMRKNVEDEDDEDEVKPKTKKSKSLKDDESLSSDNTPLNKLVTKTKSKIKREPLSDGSETDTKKKKTESPKKAKKTPPKKNEKGKKEVQKPTKTKKVVRFEKQVTKAPTKATRRRKQRMASLNAMAMVHCLYENECKSVSVSSYDSTENSEVDTPEPKRKQESHVEVKQENKETALVKYEKPNLHDPDPVINRESLRTAPGLRSIGKHWDMNSSSISSTLSDDNIEMMPPPIVIKEIAATIDKPKNAIKKKFARPLRRQVSEESSEEEKHQALLLEEKKRMVRRRRRQRKEITMDLKDMVVCKRMASLNATAILAASYSSTTGKRTITVKSSGKAEEKRENVQNYEKTESLIAKIKNRKLPFMRKKFSSSSDADVEDEADLSGSEVVVKTASSSGKQRVSLIVNQDSGVTITGLYLNSTTKSTHHQGYCSISGMQYRISSTSHTQTEATTVTTEAIVRTPQEPLRPPITVSLHGDGQSPSRVVANHASPVKTYTPLGALSNMQPPGSPHHVHHLHHHPKTVTISATQEISSLERHGCPSAFSAPTVYGPPPPPPLPSVPVRAPYPMLSKTPPEPGFVTVAKITPAPDPSILPRGLFLEDIDNNVPEPDEGEDPDDSTTALGTDLNTRLNKYASKFNLSTYPTGVVVLIKSGIHAYYKHIEDTCKIDAGYAPSKCYYQPAGPLISHHHHHHHHHHHVNTNTTTTTSTAALPASTVTSTSSSASTISFAKVSQSPLIQPPTPPASNVTHPVSENSDNEITSATTPATEIAPSAEPAQEETNYPPAYRFGSSVNPPFRSPSHNYQNYYPSPPSTASLSHPQQQAHFQEILYSNPAAGPPGPYHLSYLQPKSAPYHGPFQRRYIPALPPQQYFHHEYSASAPGSQQVVVPAHPLTSSAESYHSAPPTPSVVESYPPPPPPLYYSGYSSAPPTPYYPYATSSRSLTLVETSCPCPLQGCQKNVHTGPLTGIISKGPVKQHSTPLSPVALSLPKEPQDIRSLPSPARGSAGCRPTPSPAIATAKNPSCWSESTDCSYDTTGLLAISKNTQNSIPTKGKNGIRNSSRTELKKMKMKKSRKTSKHVCKQDENKTIDYRLNGGRPFYTDILENDSVGLITTSVDYVSRVKPTIMEIESDICDENVLIEQNDDQKYKKYRKRRSVDDQLEKDMLKAYPVMRENVQKTIHVPEDEPVVKKPKLDDLLVNDIDEKPTDVEKNDYLSALQLCSVNNVEKLEEIDQDTLNISENLAPRKREEEKNVKIQAKHVETVDQTTQRTSEEQIAEASNPTPDSATSICRNIADSRKPPRLRRKRWTTKKKNKKKSNKAAKSSEEEKIEAENAEKIRRAELLSLTQKRASCKLKWSNGWSWLGEPFVSKVFLNTEGSEVLRTCYPAMKHQSGDIIKPKDCILLRSGSKKSDLPYVAKVAHLWEDPEDGEMMMSLFWFYRPEHTEHDSIHSESPYELYASKHKDINSVACIEDKCYVLTFNEYCRYHKSIRQSEESVDVSSVIVPPLSKKRYPRHSLLPPESTSLDLVYFCRKIYDFRQHRLLKNPFFV